MSWTRRSVRTLAVGVLLGLALSFGYVTFAQTARGETLPLFTALQVTATAAHLDVMIIDVPEQQVWLPTMADDWRVVFHALAAANGLKVCELGPDTVLVTRLDRADLVCGVETPPVDVEEEEEPVTEVAVALVLEEEEASEGEEIEEEESVGLTYRVRVLQLDETKALGMGLDWSGGVFETAARLMSAGVVSVQGFFPVAQMGPLVSFLESEGVAMRLEDVELRAQSGRAVNFNRGGSISVNLVGGGAENIVQRYEFGLGLDLEGVVRDGVVELRYTFRDSSPSSVSDPSNVQIASTTSSGFVSVPCEHSVVVAAIGSARDSYSGEGLPGLAAVPGLGYAFGTGSAAEGRSAFVVTVDVGCSA